MRKGYKYRFESHSILFLFMMMVGLNMFIFTMLSIINLYLTGSLLHAFILTLIAAALFLGPFWMAKRNQEDARPLSQSLKDDVFLMGFSHASIIVGIYLAIYIGFPS